MAFNFDTEYPESEYMPDTTMQKWVRRIRNTTLNRQVFPIYTSMEGMDTPVHDLTVEQMKDITFQIVPQFYWKYEWSSNELLIHRVGKKEAPNKDLKMYDMLGNVWEWVRDDWSDNVVDHHENDGKNQMVGSTEGRDEKVIRGGAFDQYVRSVLSSTREKLERGKYKSKYGTQANVGFRPSLIYSATDEGGWTNGEPVDLFFLFDASASQNNQIGEMVETAKDIVRYFAGDKDNKQTCFVGSALYMGYDAKLMCFRKCNELKHKFYWISA